MPLMISVAGTQEIRQGGADTAGDHAADGAQEIGAEQDDGVAHIHIAAGGGGDLDDGGGHGGQCRQQGGHHDGFCFAVHGVNIPFPFRRSGWINLVWLL